MQRRSWRMTLTTCLAIGLGGAWLGSARADVRLPTVIGDNMVIQSGMTAPIWGWADAGEQVTVAILGQKKTASPDAAGKWMVKLDPIQAGGPYSMTIQGKNCLTLKNILAGEVWLCSGQSNMQMSVRSSNDADKEIAAANWPQIRLISVPNKGTQEPQSDFVGKWEACSPQNVGNFSAAAYFFGRELHKDLKKPIGLIHCSWGGSSCEAWVKRSLLEADPRYQPLLARWEQTVKNFDPAKAKEQYEKNLANWKKKVAAAKAANKPLPRGPRLDNPVAGQHRPANLYNGMLLPLIPYAIRGAIWYQGESNAGRAYEYRALFPLMIQNWRSDWGQGDFPFYFVQLANFMVEKPEPADSAWAELREAQSMTLKFPNTGQAVIIDIGDAKDIHPKNKQDVGKRLALCALAKTYGKSLVYSGPEYKSMKKQGAKIAICFDHVGGGLTAQGGGPLKGFSIAGANKQFVWADAQIVGDTVVVSSSQVAVPAAVRYAWADNPVCNLVNKAGLPAGPFRTDTWPGITVNAGKAQPPKPAAKKPAVKKAA